jgi:hypothetical protein
MVEWAPRSSHAVRSEKRFRLDVELCRPDGHGMVHWYVDPSTNDEIKCMIASLVGGSAGGLTGLKLIPACIGMGCAKQRL